MISTILDDGTLRLFNSNDCKELSTVSNRSTIDVDNPVISLLLLLSNR